MTKTAATPLEAVRLALEAGADTNYQTLFETLQDLGYTVTKIEKPVKKDRPTYEEVVAQFGRMVAVFKAINNAYGDIVVTVAWKKKAEKDGDDDEEAVLMKIDTAKELPVWDDLLIKARGE